MYPCGEMPHPIHPTSWTQSPAQMSSRGSIWEKVVFLPLLQAQPLPYLQWSSNKNCDRNYWLTPHSHQNCSDRTHSLHENDIQLQPQHQPKKAPPGGGVIKREQASPSETPASTHNTTTIINRFKAAIARTQAGSFFLQKCVRCGEKKKNDTCNKREKP